MASRFYELTKQLFDEGINDNVAEWERELFYLQNLLNTSYDAIPDWAVRASTIYDRNSHTLEVEWEYTMSEDPLEVGVIIDTLPSEVLLAEDPRAMALAIKNRATEELVAEDLAHFEKRRVSIFEELLILEREIMSCRSKTPKMAFTAEGLLEIEKAYRELLNRVSELAHKELNK
jgi:hypothetical protein